MTETIETYVTRSEQALERLTQIRLSKLREVAELNAAIATAPAAAVAGLRQQKQAAESIIAGARLEAADIERVLALLIEVAP